MSNWIESSLKGKHRLMVFKDRVVSRIFGLKREYVTGGGGGGWRRLHNEELLNIYSQVTLLR
jgi:hypothetical protein